MILRLPPREITCLSLHGPRRELDLGRVAAVVQLCDFDPAVFGEDFAEGFGELEQMVSVWYCLEVIGVGRGLRTVFEYIVAETA